MSKPLFILFLFLSSGVNTYASYTSNWDYEQLRDQYVNNDVLSFPRWGIRELIRKVSAGRLSEDMLNYVARNPDIVGNIRQVNESAEYLSRVGCEVENEPRHRDDEVDAIRHFIGSYLLTFLIGEQKARTFLTLQELRQTSLGADELMDLSNNDLGIKSAVKLIKLRNSSGHRTDYPLIPWDIFKQAKGLIKSGELEFILTSDSSCKYNELEL